MSRNRTLIGCLAVAFALLLVGCSTVGPLSRSDDKIRTSVLKRTPLGCSSDQVHAFIKQQHWQIDEQRITKQQHWEFDEENRNGGFKKVFVDGSYVRCDVGVTHFVYFPFATDVLVYWDFDKSGRLVDVRIEKQTDAP